MNINLSRAWVSMIDKVIVENKLRKIEDLLRELKSVPIGSFEAFRANIVTKRFVERNIELAVEQMVDVCKHFVSRLDLKEPETYAECFARLAQAGVISEEVVQTFQSMTRFRNMLIHIYDDVDDAVTYGIYTERLNDFTLFVGTIREYLLRDKKT